MKYLSVLAIMMFSVVCDTQLATRDMLTCVDGILPAYRWIL